MKHIIHVVVLWKLFLHHFILQLQHSPHHTFQSWMNKSPLLRVDHQVIGVLQLSEDLGVAHKKHGQTLEENDSVFLRAPGLSW